MQLVRRRDAAYRQQQILRRGLQFIACRIQRFVFDAVLVRLE